MSEGMTYLTFRIRGFQELEVSKTCGFQGPVDFKDSSEGLVHMHIVCHIEGPLDEYDGNGQCCWE